MSLKNIYFILVRPQLAENIGSVARAIKNFNITKLRIVNPRCNWPNQKALATSVGAKDILKSAKIYDSVEKSIGDLDIIFASSSRIRKVNKKIICEGDGNGPVNALDNAIRQNVDKLNKYSKYLKDLKLVDYKVRILNTGTEAITRVSIESTDSKGKNWFTIGVSANIIDASFKALVDSLDYKLFKDNAPASL